MPQHARRLTVIASLSWALLIGSPTAIGGLGSLTQEKVKISNRHVHQTDSLIGWFYRPDSPPPHPAIVLLHGCAGVTDHHHRWAETLAAWGYAALIVDSFQSRDILKLCDAGDELWTRFNTLRPNDARAALEYLADKPRIDATRAGLMGWSYGATVTLSTLSASGSPVGNTLGYKAGVAFYPSCWQYLKYFQRTKRYTSLAPLYILQGADDDWTLPAHCQRFVANAEQRSQPVTLKLYPGAYHSFDDRSQLPTRVWGVRLESDSAPWGNATIGYHRKAHQQAQKAVRAIFDRHLGVGKR